MIHTVIDTLTPDARKVLSGYCIQPACPQRGIKMSKYMPHESGDTAEPICSSCDVYYEIIGNWVSTNHGATKEFNRRWHELKDLFPGIG